MKTSLFDIENWKEIGATLARNKTRTFLTGFGIFWGVFMLAVLLGGSQGAEDLLRRNFDGFATNSTIVFPGVTTMPYKGHAKGRRWQADMTDIERLRQIVPQLQTVTAQCQIQNIPFRNGKYSYTGNVWGCEDDFSDVMLPKVESGRFINDADMRFERKVAVVGKKIANELYPGDPNPVGKMIMVDGIAYTIIGIDYQTNEVNMNGRLDEVIIIPLSTFQKAFNRGGKVDILMLVGRDGADMASLKPLILRSLFTRHQIAPEDESSVWYMNISEEFAKVDMLFDCVTFLAAFIGLSTLIAGVIGIGNIMWVIVKERTQEIGIRRAIGAKPADVTVQILSEGLTLTAVAGLAAITFACLILSLAESITANEISTPRFQMTLSQAAIMITIFIVLGTLAGLIPSLKAMRIKPIEALNDK